MAVKHQQEDTEDTIRQLIQQMGGEESRIEEYNHHMDDFDAHSEELATLRSQVEDNDENCKMLLETIDEVNQRVDGLQRELAEERSKIRTMETQMSHKEQNVFYLRNELELSKTNLEASNVIRCLAEDDLRKLKWSCLQNEHCISELQQSLNDQANEMSRLREALDDINAECTQARLYTAGLNRFIDDFCQTGNSIQRRMLFKLITTPKRKSVMSDEGKGESEENEERGLIPFCGDIDKWETVSIPFLRY